VKSDQLVAKRLTASGAASGRAEQFLPNLAAATMWLSWSTPREALPAQLRRLSEKDGQRLQTLLLQGPERLGYETPLWTCPRVAHLITQEFGVRYHEGHVWKILVGLGWSPQRPTGRARERNEKQIRHWKKKVWPAIKKKRSAKGAFSSSSTKAD